MNATPKSLKTVCIPGVLNNISTVYIHIFFLLCPLVKWPSIKKNVYLVFNRLLNFINIIISVLTIHIESSEQICIHVFKFS